jgi:hypothetical protein
MRRTDDETELEGGSSKPIQREPEGNAGMTMPATGTGDVNLTPPV